MGFSEIVGFIISIIAIFFMFIKKKADDKERIARSSDENDDESNTLEDFLKSLESDLDASKDFKKAEVKAKKQVMIKSPPPAPKSVQKITPQKIALKKKVEKQDFRFKTDMDSFTIQNSIEDKQYYVEKENVGEHLLSATFKKENREILVIEKSSTKAQSLLKRIPSKKDLIIIHEIFSPPKGFL